ncbi:unnamed protein product [Cylicostephanus goldi]|uniref:Uncharacterized protein n=1 Tax=Cylicostephanus goldi TaxID=71465 RepID=A0A3P7NTK0_CYLGO|nr:unnamed protein product [Cylicostephanus goldi]
MRVPIYGIVNCYNTHSHRLPNRIFRFTVSPSKKTSPKNIPFWKRLLSTTTVAPKPIEQVTEGSIEEEEERLLLMKTTSEPFIEEVDETEEIQETTVPYSAEETTPEEDALTT